jgi:hypothetical protein
MIVRDCPAINGVQIVGPARCVTVTRRGDAWHDGQRVTLTDEEAAALRQHRNRAEIERIWRLMSIAVYTS